MTLILSNDDIEQNVTMSECIAVLEEAYSELAAGRGVTRTRSDTLAPTARPDALYSLKSMDGIVPKLGVGAVRINSDIVTWPTRDGNARREKIPAAPNNRYVGLVLLFSCETGEPLAIFPDGVLQRLRVGATNGLAIKYLARTDAESVGILGSGWQAGGQLMAACCVRSIKRVRCFSPNPERRAQFCRDMSSQLQIEVLPAASAEDAVTDADIVLCASNSIDNIYFARWLRPGVHLSSIKRPEIESEALLQADRLVLHASNPKPLHFTTRDLNVPETNPGKGWRLATEVDFSLLPTLPELITGKIEGRTSADQVTCFVNNIGLGYQFAAAGALAYRNAKTARCGHELPTDWFTEDVHP